MDTPAPAPAAPLDSDTLWRTLHRQLLRYAQSRVRNRTLAEDAVSEVVVASLQTRARFESASHQRAWLIGVLKHKLADELRRESRWVSMEPGDGAEGDGGEGRTAAEPVSAHDPAAQCAGRRLHRALELHCRELPPTQRAAFTLRELAGLEADEICDRMGITRNHLWVLMHRARQTLQRQLADHR